MYKLRRVFAGMLCIAMALALFMGNGTKVSAADNGAKRMNVMFVMDQSGSMLQNDPEGFRYEAMDWFMGACNETGNCIGGIVFDHTILMYQDPFLCNSRDDKQLVSANMRSQLSKTNGDTDIGTAIKSAVDILVEKGDPNLPSVIILLADGNTDVGGQQNQSDLMNASIANKNDAIRTARDNNIPIYTVCLNVNGTASVSEMQDISDATKGVCNEVRNKKDLQGVFESFYEMLFDAENETLIETIVPAGGILEVPFTVPLLGVEEANITINTMYEDTEYSLYYPDGTQMDRFDLYDRTTRVQSFSMIKIVKPEAGQWRLVVHGSENENKVKISMVCNTTDTDITFSSNLTSAGLNQPIHLTSGLVNGGVAIDNLNLYQSYPIKLYVKNVATGDVSEFDMNPEATGCSYQVQFAAEGTYEMWSGFVVQDYDLTSAPVTVTVQNAAPVSTISVIQIQEKVWPFTQPYTENISQYVSDIEDANLTLSVSASDFSAQDAYLDQDTLVVNISSCGDGTLVVTATDSGGKSVSINVEVDTTSLLTILLCVLIPLIVIILVIIFVVVIVNKNKPVRGRIQILPFTDNGFLMQETQDGDRGKMIIARYWNIREDIGIDLGRDYFFHGSQTNHIYLISKRGYYTDQNPDTKSKKIRLDAEMEVKISSDIDFRNGMIVTYIPDDMGY